MKKILSAVAAAGLLSAVLAPSAEAGALRRMTAGGSNIFGYLCYSDRDSDLQGLYSLDPEGMTCMWQDPLIERAAELYTGWQRNGLLYGVALTVNSGNVTSGYNVTQDLYTGEVYEIKPVTNYFTVATLNESDGNVYGVAKVDGVYNFAHAPSGSPDLVYPICEADKTHDFISLTYNQTDGKMYGVNKNLDFVTVATDGTVTVISHVDLGKQVYPYQSGLIFSPLEHIFYWNVCFADDTSALYSISEDGLTYEMIENYSYCEEFAFFVSPDGKADPALPKAPVFVSSDFARGSLSGTVTFSMPDTTEGGTALEGQLGWTALLDNVEYKTGTAAPGSDVTVSFSTLPQGRHTFMLTATSGGKTSMRGRVTLFIGPDVPKAPAGVTLAADGTLSWQPVTEGANDGWIDLSGLVYRIYDDEGKLLDVVDDTTYKADLPGDAPLKAYRFGVEAAYGSENFSARSWSAYRVAGQPLSLPVDLTPTPEQALLFTIDDANGDGRGWIYDDGYNFSTPAAFKCEYGNVDADDWLFLPPVDFADASKVYELTLNARCLSVAYKDESFRIFVGDAPTPEAMTKAVTETLTPAQNYAPVTAYLAGVSGVKYIGIHGESKAQRAGVGIREISISESNVASATPSPAADIKARGADGGKMNVIVDFKMPSTDIAGKELAADTQLEALLSNEAVNGIVTATGRPGQTMTMEITGVQGTNNLSLVINSPHGSSPAAQFTSWCGVARPMGVTSVNCEPASDMMSARLSWNPVTMPSGDGYIDPEAVTYNLYIYRYLGEYWEPYVSGIDGPSYTYECPRGAAQEYFTFGVRAVTAAGESDGIAVAYAVLGTPYSLPMEENFETMTDPEVFSIEPYIWSRPTAAYTGEWDCVVPGQISNDIASQTGYYLVGYGTPGTKARIGIPRFTTSKSNAVVNLSTLNCNGVALFNVYAECEGVGLTLVGTVPFNREAKVHTYSFPLPAEFAGKAWVQVYFDCEFSDENKVGCIRSFSVTADAAVSEIDDAQSATVTVVDLAGRVLLRDADRSRLDGLAPGFYIVNGRKVRL